MTHNSEREINHQLITLPTGKGFEKPIGWGDQGPGSEWGLTADVGVFAGPRDGPASAIGRVLGSLFSWTCVWGHGKRAEFGIPALSLISTTTEHEVLVLCKDKGKRNVYLDFI